MNNSNLNKNNLIENKNENNNFSHKKQVVQNSIKSKVDNLVYFDERAQKLSKYFFGQKFLSWNKNFFRKRQSLAIKSLIRNLNNQKTWWLIKLPTWTGKTFLFWNIIKALETPSLILVPRENLVEWTFKELVWSKTKKWIWFESQKVQTIYWKWKWTVKDQALELLKSWEFSDTLIMTYQSFVRLSSDNPELFNELLKNIWCIISDEAHRGLWDKTKQATAHLENLITTEDETDEEIELEYENILESENFEENEEEDKLDFNAEELSEQKIEEIISKNSKLVHIKTTATPKLSNKEIDEEIIFSSTLSDVIRDGDLLLPKKLDLWVAQTEVYWEKVTNSDNNWPLDKFYFEDGTKVYEELTLQYLIQKEKNGWYLPTVSFCNTTEQVEFYTKYLLENWIKAIQCTTNKNGTNYHDIDSSEKLLESWDAEIIVTCSKVGEWWDLPTLRWAMWLVPSFSPARLMQWTWRILRILKEEDILRIMKLTWLSREYIEKTTNNTIVFSPNKWLYKSWKPWNDNWLEPIESIWWKEENDSESSSNILSEVYTWLELYWVYGELDDEHLSESWISLELSDKKNKTLKDYEIYFKENQAEFEEFWVKILDDKTIDLNNIKGPFDNELFLWRAPTTLRNLYKTISSKDFWEITFKIKAQNVLKLFFEKIWYKVNLEIKEKIILKTLDDYKKYFIDNQDEFIVFWVELLENKVIDLNKIILTNKSELFWWRAYSTLKNLYKLFWMDIWVITSKLDTQKVLKLFFESIGYEVIFKKLETINDYETYFIENTEEFTKFWVKILDNKNIDLNNTLPLRKDNTLFWGNPKFTLNQFLKLYWIKTFEVHNIATSRKVLKLFFERIWYNVNLEIEEIMILKTLDDYKKYFIDNQDEFRVFWVEILENKTIKLNNISSPNSENKIFWGNPKFTLKKLYNFFWKDIWRIDNLFKSQVVLKSFFKSLWYNVILDIKEKITLETLIDYEKYFKENQVEFEEFWVKFLENKTIDLNNLKSIRNNELFWWNLTTTLRKLLLLLWWENKRRIHKEDIPKVLKLFLEKLWYRVINFESYKNVKLDKNKQVKIDWVIYTVITNWMKKNNFPDLPDNASIILDKIWKLNEFDRNKIILSGYWVTAWWTINKLYNLKMVQELFSTPEKILTLNNYNQVEVEGVVYTAITNPMNKIDFPDLPFNWQKLCRLIKKLSPEEQNNFILSWYLWEIWWKKVTLYNLKMIQETFS